MQTYPRLGHDERIVQWLDDRIVPIHRDAAQIQDARRREVHIGAVPQVAHHRPEKPAPRQLDGCVEGHRDERHEHVGHGQRDDEIVGDDTAQRKREMSKRALGAANIGRILCGKFVCNSLRCVFDGAGRRLNYLPTTVLHDTARMRIEFNLIPRHLHTGCVCVLCVRICMHHSIANDLDYCGASRLCWRSTRHSIVDDGGNTWRVTPLGHAESNTHTHIYNTREAVVCNSCSLHTSVYRTQLKTSCSCCVVQCARLRSRAAAHLFRRRVEHLLCKRIYIIDMLTCEHDTTRRVTDIDIQTFMRAGRRRVGDVVQHRLAPAPHRQNVCSVCKSVRTTLQTNGKLFRA